MELLWKSNFSKVLGKEESDFLVRGGRFHFKKARRRKTIQIPLDNRTDFLLTQ